MIWNFPTFPSLAQHGGDHGTRGFDDGHGHGFQGGAYGGGHDQYGGGAHGGHDDSLEKKKKDDKKKLIAGAAAGVAAGAVGGAVLAEALGQPYLSSFHMQFFRPYLSSIPTIQHLTRKLYWQIHPTPDSDDEHHGGAAHGGYASGGTYVPPGQYNQLQEPLPDETHDGSSVSSSDKEDVEEAKEDYEEALKSGDKEDIEEAREEYQEEYEETYEDDWGLTEHKRGSLVLFVFEALFLPKKKKWCFMVLDLGRHGHVMTYDETNSWLPFTLLFIARDFFLGYKDYRHYRSGIKVEGQSIPSSTKSSSTPYE